MDIHLATLLPHHPFWKPAVALGLLGIAAFAVRFLVQAILLHVLTPLLAGRHSGFISVLLNGKLLRREAQILPSLIVQLCVHFVPGLPQMLALAIQHIAAALTVLHIARALMALLDALLQHHEAARGATLSNTGSIKSWVQLGQLLIGLACAVVMLAALLNKSPVIVLSGLGAMSAVLMLVFKDTILSFTAGVQLSGNDMLRVGDWIEMPQVGADGDVIDIALNTVKVQNGDKTITTIPTWRLMSESYRNWRGMNESGGRRIKRTLQIDAGSVRFLDAQQMAHFSGFALLQDYMQEKRSAVDHANAEARAEMGQRGELVANQRRLTNIGTLRAYITAYLQAHPGIHQGMTLMVRALEPTPEGVPLELYCFTSTTAWTTYENTQGDIFDHLLAILPEFDLRLYQHPSGSDLRVGVAQVLAEVQLQPQPDPQLQPQAKAQPESESGLLPEPAPQAPRPFR